MADITLKRGDTRPFFAASFLELGTGGLSAPINLTQVTAVRFVMQTVAPDGVPHVVAGTAIVGTAAEGELIYQWAPLDTAVPGTYKAEFQLTWVDGKIETVPNDRYLEVEILPDLGS